MRPGLVCLTVAAALAAAALAGASGGAGRGAAPAATSSPLPMLTPSPSPTPVETPTPEPTPSPVPTPEPELTPTPEPTPVPPVTPAPTATPRTDDISAVRWRRSRALGKPFRRGRLRNGVQLPEQGIDFFTWDPVWEVAPNRASRRWGTDTLVFTLLTVIHEHRLANPRAPRVAIGDLSRPNGGIFDRRFGGLGHASHQNGLDADVFYARKDRKEMQARQPRQVDRRFAQDLVNRFVAAGAEKVFVGPRLGLKGPRHVVVPLVHHDDHLHVRIRNPRR